MFGDQYYLKNEIEAFYFGGDAKLREFVHQGLLLKKQALLPFLNQAIQLKPSYNCCYAYNSGKKPFLGIT